MEHIATGMVPKHIIIMHLNICCLYVMQYADDKPVKLFEYRLIYVVALRFPRDEGIGPKSYEFTRDAQKDRIAAMLTCQLIREQLQRHEIIQTANSQWNMT